MALLVANNVTYLSNCGEGLTWYEMLCRLRPKGQWPRKILFVSWFMNKTICLSSHLVCAHDASLIIYYRQQQSIIARVGPKAHHSPSSRFLLPFWCVLPIHRSTLVRRDVVVLFEPVQGTSTGTRTTKPKQHLGPMIVRNPLQLDPLATSSDEGLDVEGRHVRILYPDILTQDWNHLDGRSVGQDILERSPSSASDVCGALRRNPIHCTVEST